MVVSPRTATVFSGWALAFGVAVFPSLAAPTPPTGIGGVVRDALGSALVGVEVLVLSDASAAAVGSAVTDEAGRFRVSELPAGLYRVAALKPGYLASVARANTYLRSTVDVILRPLPRAGEPNSENVTERPTWVLRAPQRSILRETDLRDIAGDRAGTTAPARDSSATLAQRLPFVEVVQGEFRQLVALGGSSAYSGAGEGPIVGGETSMLLSSTLGQRGSVRLSGRRESLATSRVEFEGAPTGSRSAESLAFDIHYDTSHDTNLGVSAYYANGDVRLGKALDAPVDADHESRRSWGYDAIWTMQLDQASRFAVRLGYRDASLGVSDAYLRGFGVADEGASRNITNRALGATGSYEVLVGDNHLVRVGARAQMLDLTIPIVRDGGEALFVEMPGAAGWSVRLDADDAWSVSGPWTLVYGLGVQQVLEGARTTILVPRTGAVWSPGGFRVGMHLSYHAFAGWGDASSTERPLVYGAEELRPPQPIGWEVEFETPLGAGVTLRASQRYEPIRDAARTGSDREAKSERSLAVGGGSASDRLNSVALTRQARRVSTSVAWTWGTAEGLIGQAAGFDLPVQILAERTIGYRSGRIDVLSSESGTDVAVEYRRFEESSAAETDVRFVNSYLEVAMGQRVAHLNRLGANCRFLLSARLSPGRSDRQAGERARTIAALNQRISAGLLVSF